MSRPIAWAVLWVFVILSWPATAETVTLKLAFFTSDQEVNWVRVIKPFVEAVNSDPRRAVKIEAYPNGALGKSLPQQPQMILDAVADIAWVVPSLSSGRFADDTLFEVPGLLTNLAEGTRLYEALVGSSSLRGYPDYVVLGSFMNANLSVSARRPIKSLGDLKGMKVRILGPVVGQTARELGMVPVLMPPNEVVEAIGRGTIDAAMTSPSALVDFGIDRVTSHDYFLQLGTNSLSVLMSRTKFDSMPKEAQDVIKKYSGRWLNDLFIKEISAHNQNLIDRFKADPKRTFVVPSPADVEASKPIFAKIANDWAARAPRNEELLTKSRELLAEMRSREPLR